MSETRPVTVAATQMACGPDSQANIARAEALVREAAAEGAQVILLQELFETPYFPKEQVPEPFDGARPAAGNPLIRHFAALAEELGVVLPLSFFERANNAFFNALTVIDRTGRPGAVYRKAHIPQNPGYEEKYYFSPGDTGFRVWDTAVGRIGVAICWDQWFPEAARAMVLQGAELLFYPTAIGSEPADPEIDSRAHWQTAMCGHAAANVTPVIASNRIGTESGRSVSMTFYGSSFITDHTGQKIAEADRVSEGAITATLDLGAIQSYRTNWGLLRDRRPDLYGPLLTLDGGMPAGQGPA